MASIVDFEQDPEAPLGTGNFRDDKGRVMYAHDPETASKFIKTMRGASLSSTVASETDAIATKTLGAPNAPKGPDGRLASVGDAATAEIDAVNSDIANLEKSVADAGMPRRPGDAAKAEIDAVKGDVSKVEQMVNAVAAAQGVAPAGSAAPGTAANGPPAGTPSGKVEQMVNAVAAAQGRTAAKPTAPTLDEPDTRGLPPASVHVGDSVSIEEGRPEENVDRDVAAIDESYEQKYAGMRAKAERDDAANDVGLASQAEGVQSHYGETVKRFYEQRQKQAEAEAEKARLEQALKENSESLDPDRYVRNMSGGKKLAMIILAALNGGFNALMGSKENQVLDALKRGIDTDIERQKEEIRSKNVAINNDIARLVRKGHTLDEAEAITRDKAEQALVAFKELHAKRQQVKGQNLAATEAMIASLEPERIERRNALLAQAEDKIKRARDTGVTHARPEPVPGMSPQEVKALMDIDDRQTEAGNTKWIEEIVGHPVTGKEAERLLEKKEDFGEKNSVNQDAKDRILRLASALGAKLKADGTGFEHPDGKPDPGWRPLGWSASQYARHIDGLYDSVKEAKVLRNNREPAQEIQRAQAEAAGRPLNDSDILPRLDILWAEVQTADSQLRKAYGEASLVFDAQQQRLEKRKKELADKPGAPKPQGGMRVE